MTLNDIYLSALTLMGYPYSKITSPDHPFSADKVNFFRCIFFDLGLPEVTDFNKELTLSAEECDVVCMGVAMYIALYMGDRVKHSMITDMYNAKRRKLKSGISQIQNVIP